MKVDRLKEIIKLVLQDEAKQVQGNFNKKETSDFRERLVKEFREVPKLKKKEKTVYFTVLKIAAAVLMLISVSVGIYLISENTLPDQFYEAENIDHNQNNEGTVLILSDGSEIGISSDESIIEYDKLGQKVKIDSDSTLILDKENQEMETSALHELMVPYGKQSKIILSDGSMVWLNSGTTMLYPQEFRGKKREIYLIGEAYFEVSENKSKPFVVHTHDIEIEVLGTAFNVLAYEENTNVEAVLVEGSVKVGRSDDHILRNKSIVLSPGQMASYSKKDKSISTEDVNTEPYISWKDGYFLCESISLQNLTQKLSRYYNKQIIVSNDALIQRKFSGKLENREELEDILEIICLSKRLSYVRENENLYRISE